MFVLLKSKILNKYLYKIKKCFSLIKKTYIKLILFSSTSLCSFLIPISSSAITSSSNEENIFLEVIEEFGNDVFTGVKVGAIKVVIVFTVIRLVVEFCKGGTKYRMSEIAKQFVIILVLIVLVPFIPTLIEILVKRYITSNYLG